MAELDEELDAILAAADAADAAAAGEAGDAADEAPLSVYGVGDFSAMSDEEFAAFRARHRSGEMREVEQAELVRLSPEPEAEEYPDFGSMSLVDFEKHLNGRKNGGFWG